MSLLCGPRPIYGRFIGFFVNGFLSKGFLTMCFLTMPMLANAHISSLGYLWYNCSVLPRRSKWKNVKNIDNNVQMQESTKQFSNKQLRRIGGRFFVCLFVCLFSAELVLLFSYTSPSVLSIMELTVCLYLVRRNRDQHNRKMFFSSKSLIGISVFTWRYGGHIGVPKQWSSGQIGVLNQSCGSWTLFLCKRFLLFQ